MNQITIFIDHNQITRLNKYNFADFFISVFEVNQANCPGAAAREHRSGSGCCVAHGGNVAFVGKTWQEILDAQSVTSILGGELHRQLTEAANSGGRWIEYTWASAGQAETKRAWASIVVPDGEYYVVVEYMKTPPPPTCDSCPEDQGCEEPAQEFCVEFQPTPAWVHWAIGSLALLLIVGVVFVLWYRARSKARNVEKRRRAMSQAEEQRDAALRAQKAALDSAKRDMKWPDTWDMQPGLDNAPQEGLIDVPPESPEYWDVFDKLRALPQAVRQ